LNDANVLEDVLKKNGDQIGAFLIEPIMGNCGGIPAQAEYLKAARELCDRHDVVMIIDEVKTGFRVARGGVQELMGVKADLCTFAKALANGYPISAVAGREEIMRKIGDGVAHGGTYTAHSVTIAAANKTLEILDETDALKTIETYGKNMQAGISKILDGRGIAHKFVGHASMAGLFFCEEAPTNYRDWVNHDSTLYDTLAENLHDQGILCEPDNREPWFLAEAHDAACLKETVETIPRVGLSPSARRSAGLRNESPNQDCGLSLASWETLARSRRRESSARNGSLSTMLSRLLLRKKRSRDEAGLGASGFLLG
jgi:glutamate-1-semialdehyde 2,1-aminomutase